MSTTTDLTTLKINYLTQAQYDTAKSQGLINTDELYLTPAADSGINDVTVDGVSVVTDNVAEITMPTIPTKVSDLTNDSGFITGYTETDPTVPSWAKASSKPSYTASEVGAVPTTRTVNGKALSSDITLSSSDVSALPSSTVIPTVNNATLTIQKNGTTVKTFTANASSNVTANITVPTATSDLTNDSGFITGYTETDPVFAASAAHGITSSDISTWNGKSTVSVTRHTTSGTNIADLTINGTTTKLYAPQGGGGTLTDVTVDGTSVVTGGVAEIDLTGKADVSDIPTKVSDLTNDSGYITGYTETDPTVPSWAKASSKPSYTASEVGAVPTSRTVNGKALSSNITLSASDVSALPSSTVIPTITDTYSGTSSNGMSGKAVKSAIDALDGTVTGSAGSGKTLTAFSQTDGKVSATFGNISITKSQVSDFPTIPSKTSDLTNDSGYITGYTETDPVFSASAAHGITSSDISNWNGKSDFSGSYNDLTDKPTIPPAFDSWRVKRVTPVSNYSFKGTVANAWEYIGTSFTVPAGHIYVVQLQASFASGKPLGIGLNSSTSISSAYGFPDLTCCESANGCNRGTAVLSGGTNGMTYYVFCKRATVPSSANTHAIFGLDFYE